MDNKMILEIKAISENESFARSAVAAFATFLNPTIDCIADIKTIVSEAVTNAIIHGYKCKHNQFVKIEAEIEENLLTVKVIDTGVGMRNIKECIGDFYTTCGDDERSGLGFTIIKTLSDGFFVDSEPDVGTTVTIKKQLS